MIYESKLHDVEFLPDKEKLQPLTITVRHAVSWVSTCFHRGHFKNIYVSPLLQLLGAFMLEMSESGKVCLASVSQTGSLEESALRRVQGLSVRWWHRAVAHGDRIICSSQRKSFSPLSIRCADCPQSVCPHDGCEATLTHTCVKVRTSSLSQRGFSLVGKRKISLPPLPFFVLGDSGPVASVGAR